MTEEYFAFSDSVEYHENKALIRFDMFLCDYFFEVIKIVDFEPNNKTLGFISEISTRLLDITLTSEDLPLLNGLKLLDKGMHQKFQEGSWYKISISPEGLVEGEFFNNPTDETSIQIRVLDIEFLDPTSTITKLLEDAISFKYFREAPEEEVDRIFTKPSIGNIVACYEVGQGNCNAVCDLGGMPLLYFDFGGGVGRNAHTYPKGMRFCVSAKPPIILSHWDMDHWISGLHFPSAQDVTWIAPKQPIGLTHLKFVINLNKKGNLLLWPHNLPKLNTIFGTIIKLSIHGNRNMSGLIFFAKTYLNAPGNNKSKEIMTLLPGDAPYNQIMAHHNVQFDELVATHHGGYYQKDTVPKAPNNHSKIAYSYGKGNSYGHPDQRAVDRHRKAGWTRQLDTINGNIALAITGPIPQLPCVNKCDLQLKQS